MNPIVILVPLLLVVGGVVTFFLVPLDLPIRIILLVSEVMAAGLVGYILWRRYQG